MFKIESYIGPLLMSYLNKYVKLNEESFKLSLWGGDAVFHNVELQCDILEHLMLLPIGFKSGQVHELKIHIPWTKLGSESVIITLNTVECILELKSDFIKKTNSDSPTEPKNPEASPEKQKYEKNVPPGYIKSYLFNIISNIHIKVNNLIIKFVEDDIVLSMNAKTLEYFPVTKNWVKGFINFSAENLKVYKVIEVFDLTICLDQMDSNGQIEVYQEPILYRCSVECRFLTNYRSINSNLSNFIKFNIKFGDIDMNISTSQMPHLRRLIELVYSLYYGTINWDSIVGCGFSKQVIVATNPSIAESKPETLGDVDSLDKDPQKSWASWVWSYVPSIFEDEEDLIDEDQISSDTRLRKTFIFGINFQSINWKIKKSYITKSIFGSRRSNCNKTLNHFLTIACNNTGFIVINNGLEFFNVQLACTEIKIFDVGNMCVCGQEIFAKQEADGEIQCNEFILIGSPEDNQQKLSEFYLAGNLFTDTEAIEGSLVDNDINRLNSITSQESYTAMYPREKCLEKFHALWFDYVYFMQIVKNNLDESQIDLLNLCNTDGIRESSQCNLYIGKSVVDINSYFVHNMTEIIKSLDTSSYLSYFRSPSTEDETRNMSCPLEEQVARIHEFVPVREQNICLVKLSIKMHAFIESHQIPDECPILEIETNSFKYSKLAPMYPKSLVGCVSMLNTNLLKESTELINKCYVIKSSEIMGFSISFLLPVIQYDNNFSGNFIRTRMLDPCSINLSTKWLLYPDTWKTSSLVLSEKNLNVSKIKLMLIPSHIKASAVIIASNYPWISKFGSLSQNPVPVSMYKRLDDLTLQLLGTQSFLIEACHKYFYQNKTYELHVSLPNFALQSRKTVTSSFIDVKVFHDTLLLYLRDPDSTFTIPILDNNLDGESRTTNKQSDLYILSCQIPNHIKHVNCKFNIKCQMGSINFMFSQQLISWFIYPLLDLDLDKYIDSDIFPRFSSLPKNNSTNRSSITILDIRSIADGSSRPQSPNLFYNKQPVPGLPKAINVSIETKTESKIKFLSGKSGWWNVVKDSCSKYFFLLQSLDVCIKMSKSKFYITTITDTSGLQSQETLCNNWVEHYLENRQNDGSIFVIKLTRLALINSQRREYLNENFQPGLLESLNFQTKSSAIIDSFPWELIFHDICIDCLHSSSLLPQKLIHDSILKPVSINCTLSATPKCSSPDKLDTLYSVSWGVHIDITEVQPTIKQMYLAKILKLFFNIVFGLPWMDFTKNLKYLIMGHYRIVKDNLPNKCAAEEKPIFKSKQSASTKSTKRSKSSMENYENPKILASKNRIVNSKLETQSINEVETQFKMSFWIQCTLAQFQLLIMNDVIDMDDSAPYVYLMLQIDDATSCIDVQEKFVEIKGKLGSILCQIGLMKHEEMISEIPILKTGSKFIKNTDIPFSSKSSQESDHMINEMAPDNIIRHCFSIAVIRTTPNNLSKRPISSYHQFNDSESFKSYPTEFTGNFSTAINLNDKYQGYITQISSIIDPFDLYLPPFFLKQCLDLSNTFVSLYNQLLQTSFQKWSLPSKSCSPISASSIKNEPYFISEDIPQFHLLVKSSRIIIPRYQNEKSIIYDNLSNENGCIILLWSKISIQPFSNNAISRPPIIDKSSDDDYAASDSRSKCRNCLDDNRQFQLDVFKCGIFSNQSSNSITSLLPNQFLYSDRGPSDCERSSGIISTSIIHGQNPAFEWNNFSKFSSFIPNNSETELLPIMNPIDIQIIFAGVIHESSNLEIKRQLAGGYGLEINILTNLEFFFDNCALDIIQSILTNVNEILHENGDKSGNKFPERENNVPDVCSLEDFCRIKNIDNFIPCVPINILMTSRKIQLLLLLQKSKEVNQLSPVHGISMSISQPHAMLSYKDRQNHKLEIAFFDVNFSVTPPQWSEKIDFHNRNHSNFWFHREPFILAEMKTIMKTKPGRLDLKTGVPASLLTMVFSNFYRPSSSQCVLSITRQVLVSVDIEDIIQLSGLVGLLLARSQSENKSDNSENCCSSSSFPWIILIPNSVYFCSELFSVIILDGNNQFQLKLGPLNISSNLIRNYHWNNLCLTAYFRCNSLVVVHSVPVKDSLDGQLTSKFILYPVKITGKAVLNNYRFNSLDEYWKSLESFSEINIGPISISVEEDQMIVLYKLLTKIMKILSSNRYQSVAVSRVEVSEKIINPVEIFYDELRTNKFQLITNSNPKENDYVSCGGSGLIADEGTICFSDDNDDVASMLWTYPEPRCILSLEVKPVPFVFIECNFSKDDNLEKLQVPCTLEYWNISTNQYELYRTFNLSENQTEKMDNLPSVEQLSQYPQNIVVAKSWRVVFDCYARYVNVHQKTKSDTEKAMLVYLSPLVLAASMRVDSCYGSFLVKNLHINFSIPQIEVIFHENKKEDIPVDLFEPYKLINKVYEDYSISHNNILFKFALKDFSYKLSFNEMKEIQISKTEFFLSDPFMAFQLPITVLEDLKVRFYECDNTKSQITLDINACQLGLDTISLKQMYLIIEKVKHLLANILECTAKEKTTFTEKPQLLICNNLNRKIRIKQKQDHFLKMSDTAKVGGIGCGDAVLLKFLPIKQVKIHLNDDDTDHIPNATLELVLGLCSELKGSIKWTEPVELPLLNFNYISETGSNFGLWKLDINNKSDVCLLTNSSSLSNSFHAKNLFFIHNYGCGGLNKIIILGNAIINNISSHLVHINFSLPTELSSGVSFPVPPQLNSIPTSQYINWKLISSLKNIFELSFRVMDNTQENVEYRSLAYQVRVPKLTENIETSHQQLIIRLKLYKANVQIISTRNLHMQLLCTLEWFRFREADEILLLITISPLVILENQMLRDVKLDICNTALDKDNILLTNEDPLVVPGKGGHLKLMNLFPSDSVKLNASFINDSVMLFDKPLELTERGVLESMSKKLNFIYDGQFGKMEEKEKLEYIAGHLMQFIQNNELVSKNHYPHNPYSVIVTISPWILISNKTQLNLVLSFDKDIYFLESNSDFIPPQSDKSLKLGFTFENDVFWSKQFLVGQNAINQIDNSLADLMWNFNKNDTKDEAILQICVMVGQHKYVPLTLRHLFADNSLSNEMPGTRFHHLIIESSFFISNQTDFSLEVESLWLTQNVESKIENRRDEPLMLIPKCSYLAINQFHSNGLSNEKDSNDKLMLKINVSGNNKLTASLFNCVTMVDLKVFSTMRDSELDMETNFFYVKNITGESNRIDFLAFTVNNSISLATQKVFIDIFECKSVPIKITNWTCQTILISELIDDARWNRSSLIQVEPMHTIPYWPINFQIDINKDGCGMFSRSFQRFKLGVEFENEIDWTEYFPLTYSELPTTIDVATVSNKSPLQLKLDSDHSAKVHIHLYSKAQSNEDLPSEQISHWYIKKLSVSRLSFSLLERQVDLETLVESVRVSVENLGFTYSSNSIDTNIAYELCVDHIQVDNKLFSSGLYDFPVFLNSLKTQEKPKFLSIRVETNNGLNHSLSVAFHNELELFVENVFLYDLLRIFSQFSHCLLPKMKNSNSSPVYSVPPVNITHMKISPVLLRVTVHAFLKIYVSCEATSLALPEFIINDCSLRLTAFQKRLWNHYVTAVLVRCGCVLGSIEMFGNPNGIVRHLATGLTDLLSSRNIDHGLLTDFLLRLLSFCKHTSGGFISSFTGIATSVSRNLDYFTLDDTHITRQDLLRRRFQSNGVMHGFLRGLSGFALSLLGAVAGLADQPLQASQEALNTNSSVSIAVIKGLGKGLIGAVTKPLSGTAELLAQTGRGLLNTTGIAVNRCHSQLIPFTLSSRFDILIDANRFMYFSLTDDIVPDGMAPVLFWSAVVVNDDQLPVYLFLTNHFLIEWFLDNPLRNKKSVYFLSSYTISVGSHVTYRHCLRLQSVNKMNDFVRLDCSQLADSCYSQNFNVDSRINAFISELQYAKESDTVKNDSRTSSMDSAEYVKFTSVPSAYGCNANNVDEERTSGHGEQINFYSNHSLDGILDALAFLNYEHNQAS